VTIKDLSSRLALICALTLSWPALAIQRVMLTAFEPFGSSSTNRSYDVALRMKRQLEAQGIHVDVCLLPVVYDEASKVAEQCWQTLSPKPDLAVSMGEAACAIKMETAGLNRDSSPGFPDNSGQIRTGSPIAEGAPAKVPFHEFVTSMYCSAPPQIRNAITVSSSPGGFVCNNVAYSLGSYFQDRHVPYTFIHVPNNRCQQPSTSAQATATTLSGMIVSYSRRHPVSRRRDRHASELCRPLPTTIAQVNTLIDSLNEIAAPRRPQCSLEFANKLKAELANWHDTGSTY
jgi:pyrrolidone-carboxylate peptidase